MDIKKAVYDVSILSNKRIAEDLYTLEFESKELSAGLQPGQFFSIAVGGEPKQVTRIPLSPYETDAENNSVSTIYNVCGAGTSALSKMNEGDITGVLGPSGNGWDLSKQGANYLLISGGVGVAPILSAAHELKNFSAIVGSQTEHKLFGVSRLKALGAEQVIVTTDDGSAGTEGFTTDVLPQVLSSGSFDIILACGPEPMLSKIATIAHGKGISCQVSLERTMTCGFGACATCIVETKHGKVGACMKGPVFDAEEVIW